ncbi:MAG TPA: nucleotidyltransferase family protein [Longimicrobium sp.]|nr:nucleotidyltransferase family protein [Longimicrobium sp.]
MGDSQRACAASALLLRGWALGVLTGGPASLPPQAGAEAWETFLRVERCAHPLRRVLAAAGLLDQLPDPAREALERRGLAEAAKTLALRHEAGHVARLLGEHGWEGIVLKGGAAVLAGSCEVDVTDLDVLVRPEQSRAVAAELDASGYRHQDHDFGPGAPNRHEMAARIRENALPVELHFALAPPLERDPWAGAEPLPVPGLLRLSPANHLWHVLSHGTLHHPERRGSLRDLLVAAAAARGCGGDDLREVEHRCAAHPEGELPARMLRMARSMAAGRAEDLFRREAATAYLVYLFTRRYRPFHGLLLALARTAFALARGQGEYGGLWYGSHISAIPRGYAGASPLDRVFPAAALAVRAAWRSANLAAAFAPAAWMARTARRLAEGG